jgi:hypothetical protein
VATNSPKQPPMARPRNLIPSESLHLRLSGPLQERLSQLLWSDIEGRVPVGAYQKFFTELVIAYLNGKTLDVSHWAPVQMMVTPGTTVRGSPQAIETLETLLKELSK